MSEEMVRYKVQPEIDLMTLGQTLAKSGYFQDARDAAQAIVKVLAGREFGMGPIASMTGIHIIQGRPAVGATLMGAAVKASGRYNYKVRKLEDTEASIEFFERHGEQLVSIGVSTFTAADGKRAGTKNMDKFPRNMLYARAMSNGVKWYCPDVFMAPIYTPEELGAMIDGETGEIIDQPAMSNGNSNQQSSKMFKPAVTPPAEPPLPPEPDAAKRAFFDKVLREIPYYRAIQHVGNTLKQAGFTGYSIDKEQAMWEALQAHANAEANAAAASETVNVNADVQAALDAPYTGG